MRRRYASLFALSVAALAGCASMPEPRTLEDLEISEPVTWAASSGSATVGVDAEALDGWIVEFGDDRLRALIEEGLNNNRDLRVAAARLDAAKAQAKIAGADRLPTIGASSSGSRRKQNFIGLPIPGASGGVLSTTSTTLDARVDVSWEADIWGRAKAGQLAARAAADATAADVQDAQYSLAAAIASSWYAAIEAHAQVELAERTVKIVGDSVDGIELRYRAGTRGALDLRLARSQLAGAEALLATRRAGLSASLRALESLLGRYPSAGLEVPLSLPDSPQSLPAGIPADIVARRPDLRAAELRIVAADAGWLQAKRSLYPRLQLTGSAGTSSNELADLLDGDFSVWSLFAGLTQPLFQGGRLRANVDLADAGTREAVESFAGQVLRAFGEVEAALANEAFLRDRELALERTLDESVAARELSQQQYRAGLIDVLTLLDAQRRALDAESSFLQVQRELLTNRIDAYLALGGNPYLDGTLPLDRRGDVGVQAVESRTALAETER